GPTVATGVGSGLLGGLPAGAAADAGAATGTPTAATGVDPTVPVATPAVVTGSPSADGVPTVGLPTPAVPAPTVSTDTPPTETVSTPTVPTTAPGEVAGTAPTPDPLADGAAPAPTPADAAPPTDGTEADGQEPGAQVPGLPGSGALPGAAVLPTGTAQDAASEGLAQVQPLGVDAMVAALQPAPVSASVQQVTTLAPVVAAERQAPAPPAQQLAAEIVPLRDKTGEHSLTVSLHPVDLGPITVTARIQGTDIHLDLGGATESGREALRNALPDLRRELERAGFTSCLLDTNAGGSSGERRMPWQLPRGAQHSSGAASAVTGLDLLPVRPRVGTGQLDLHA
ncbi:flagellar hook-length control protein FliK, partial [Actinophytocola xanthii]